MSRRRWSHVLIAAAPGFLLAGFGLAHPARLDAATAEWWTCLHVFLLPVFPLLAAALWFQLSRAPRWLRSPGRLAAFGFAAFYGGLDAVAGIAAGTVVAAQHGATAVVGEVSFLDSHLFWPRGVFTMLGIAAGMALLVVTEMPSSPCRSAR